MIMTTALGTAAGASLRPNAGPKYGGTVVLSGGAETPIVLDPTQTGFAQPGAWQQLAYGGSLFVDSYKPGGPYIDDEAAGYKYSDGGKTFTLTLKSGLKFSDGS